MFQCECIQLFTELPESNNIFLIALNKMINLVDSLTLIMFCTDIILKWIDGFVKFWKVKWNVFELIITALVNYPIIVCQIIVLYYFFFLFFFTVSFILR